MKPEIICHMISTVDGRLITDRWTGPYDGKNKDEVMQPYFTISDELGGDAWMIGRITLQRHYFPGTFDHTPYPAAINHETFIGKRKSKRAVVVIDPKGKIKYDADHAEGDNIIAVLGEKVSGEYLAFLQEKRISYLFAGPDGNDIGKAMETLGTVFGMKRILLEGGGIINGTFLKAGLIDELSLMVYPGIDGLAGMPTIFEYMGKDGELPASGQSLELVSNKLLDNGVVWLYYRFHHYNER